MSLRPPHMGHPMTPAGRAALVVFTMAELRAECLARAESPARLFASGEIERQFYFDLAAALPEPYAKHVAVSDELVAELRAKPSTLVTVEICSVGADGRLEMVFTRATAPTWDRERLAVALAVFYGPLPMRTREAWLADADAIISAMEADRG